MPIGHEGTTYKFDIEEASKKFQAIARSEKVQFDSTKPAHLRIVGSALLREMGTAFSQLRGISVSVEGDMISVHVPSDQPRSPGEGLFPIA